MKWLLLPLGLCVAYGIAMVVAHPTFIYPFGADPFNAPDWQDAGLAVTLHLIDGATHNNLAGQVGYQARIDAFIAGLDA